MISADIQTILPEIALSVYAMVALLGAVYTIKDGAASTLVWLTSGVFLLLAAWIATRQGAAVPAFDGMFVSDSFSRFAKVTILISAAAVLVMSETYMARRNLLRFGIFPHLINSTILFIHEFSKSSCVVRVEQGGDPIGDRIFDNKIGRLRIEEPVCLGVIIACNHHRLFKTMLFGL